ncbi:GNAT family N-acetyltransferase, partial [Rhizobium ruizarguesonis]
RTIGLDGVAAQQAKSRTAGFEPAYSPIRYGGVATSLPVSTLVAQPVLASRLEGLPRYASAIFPQPRDAFLPSWCTG